LKSYDIHFKYCPAIDDLYPDSIYVEELGVYRPFNLNVYIDRFLNLKDNETAEESEYILYEIIYKVDGSQSADILKELENAAAQHKSTRLGLEAEYMRLMYENKDETINSKEFSAKIYKFADKAEKREDYYRKARALSFLLHRLWYDGEPDYPAFFKNALIITRELDDPVYDAFYEKRYANQLIGDAYYFFRDYDKAIPYLQNAISDNVSNFYDRSNLKALNTLSACYYAMGNPDSMLYYSYRMLESEDMVKLRPMYDIIAISNIGHYYSDQKRYDEAIPYLQAGLEGALREEDLSFATGVYIGLGESYLGKKDLKKTAEMLDSARILLETHDYISSRYRQYYKLLSKYYAMTHNPELSIAYMDSTLEKNQKYIERYSALNIVKAEQELFQTIQEAQEHRLKRQRRTLIVSLTILSLTILMLFTLLFFYDKKRKAYKRFKEKTGMTPTDFRKNNNSQMQH